MTLLIHILIVVGFSLHDHFVKLSHGKKWEDNDENRRNMDYWHWCKYWIVVLIGATWFGQWGLVAEFYLIYFALFEVSLNIFNGDGLLYLSNHGSDKWRKDNFGTKAALINGLLKLAAIVLIILIEIYLPYK